MSDLELSSYALDAAYKPFPTFAEWASKTEVDTVRWDRYTSQLAERGRMAPEVLARCRQIATRAAALDTGAIEGLYEVDRGFTYTVAIQGAAWEAGLAARGEQVRPLFDAQLHAYDFVLSLATTNEPFSEAAVRVLHEQICAAQQTYRVETPVGPQEQPLPKGQYKSLPNHVRTRKGENHSYAPVDVTPSEMARLLREMRTEEFLAAHTVLQASYVHYALVVIHPFADGNGRVARALASVFTYRDISMPIVILSEDKVRYLDALESADRGDYEVFVSFMLEKSLDTMQLVLESLKANAVENLDENLSLLNRLYLTKGGYTQDQVEKAVEGFLNLIWDSIQVRLEKIRTQNVSASVDRGLSLIDILNSSTGKLMTGSEGFTVDLRSAAPANAAVSRSYFLLVPEDAGSEDDLQLRMAGIGLDMDTFTARMSEVIPAPSGSLRLRVSIFADRVIAEMVHELLEIARMTQPEQS